MLVVITNSIIFQLIFKMLNKKPAKTALILKF